MKANEAGKLYDLSEHRDGVVGKRRKNIVSPQVVTEHAASKEKNDNGGDVMDQDKLLEKYIDTVDQDRREMEKRLTEDRRESEVRIREEITQREKRFEETIKKDHDDNKERENRFFSAIEKLETTITEQNKDMKASIEKSENRIDESVKHLENIKHVNFWGQVAFILSIAAIIVTFITQS